MALFCKGGYVLHCWHRAPDEPDPDCKSDSPLMMRVEKCCRCPAKRTYEPEW